MSWIVLLLAVITGAAWSQTPTLSLSANPPSPSNFGTTITLTATSTASAGPVTVTFFDGTTPLGTATMNPGTRTAPFQTSTLAVGTHQLTASYQSSNATVTSNALAYVVNTVLTATVKLTAAPNPSVYCQAVTLTATVTGSGTGITTPMPPTGSVTFSDASTPLGQPVTIVNGVATATVSNLAAGSHILTAAYSGDQNYPATSGSATQTVNQVSTSINLTSAPNPSTLGQSVGLTAAIIATACGVTGTVTFLDGATPLSTVQITGTTGTYSISSLSVGSHPLTAKYNGDANNAASTSSAITQVVNVASSTTSLAVSPNPANAGQAVSLTATVTPSSATGTVTFSDNGTALGTANVTNGTATLITSILAAGTHSLTAAYGGAFGVGPSTSAAVTLTINRSGSTVALAVAPNPSTFGQAVTMTATVTPAAASGTVAFREGTTTLGSGTLSAGKATFTTSALAAGTHALTATYNGDTSNAPADSNAVSLAVNKATTTTALAASPSPAAVGQTVTLSATISPSGASGAVRFLDGTNLLGTANLNAGAASFTTSSLSQGAHSLTASYAGDNNFAASTSTAVSLTVNPAGPGTLTITGPASLPGGTINTPYPQQTFTATGGTGNYTWSLVSSGTNTNDLQLSPSGVLSGTPQMAGTFQVMVQVRDSASPPAMTTKTYNVTFDFGALPPVTFSVSAQPATPADQPLPQFAFGQPYPVALKGTFSLSFTPNAAALPAGYTNAAVQFAGGGTTAQVNLLANSTAAVALPAIQVGSVAGSIDVRLTALANAATGQAVPMPSQVPSVTITIPRIAPLIVPGSVKITNITSSGFQLGLDANSTPRDLIRANVSFNAASGAQLTGTQTFAVPLDATAATWFPSTAGVAAGGAFSVVITFGYTGDTSAIGTVSVTLTNSIGTSAAVTGGR